MSQAKMVSDYTEKIILTIWEKHGRAAILAKFRRALGKEVGMAPQIWEYTLDLPEELQGDGGEPSHGENAIFIALTLFAMHAQGSDDIVHWKDVTLGTAVSKLRAKFQDSEKGIRRRFDALITAKSCDEIAVHARGMIQLLKAGGIGLDYGQFAAHVYLLQFPESAKRVRLSWGQDYFRSSVVHDQEGAENE